MTVKGVDAPCEPPTPDHPPPSPETALLDIQQLINSEVILINLPFWEVVKLLLDIRC